MLTHPMLDQLGQLGLSGMAQAFAELEASDETAALTHATGTQLFVNVPEAREIAVVDLAAGSALSLPTQGAGSNFPMAIDGEAHQSSSSFAARRA